MRVKPSQRVAITLAILLFWGGMMGLLLKREVMVAKVDPLVAATRLEAPTESWMGLYTGAGDRVGYVHLQQIPESREELAGATSRLAVRMTLNLFGRSTDLDLSGWAWRSYDQPRSDFEFRVRSGEHDFRLAGEVADGVLRAEIHSAGEVLPLELPVSSDLQFASGFASTFSLPPLEVGEEVEIESFDPMTLKASPVRVRCIAREVRELAGRKVTTRVVTLESRGLTTRAWMDESGEVLRAETPIGLVLEATTAEQALEPITGTNVRGFLDLTAIQPAGRRPFRGARSMTVELTGFGEQTLPVDDMQRQAGEGRLRITTAAEPRPGAVVGDGLDRHLAADPFVQADHPIIVSQTQEILAASGDDPWRRASDLFDWVYTELDKAAVISIPSALEVLEQRVGDCNEHTVLYTALARAAGLPTRIAIGIVWSDDFGGFYYHAWPEVHIDGRWIWIDPTLGQPIADATHIKLLNGGIETWTQLLPFLGRLEIRVVDIE